LRGNIISNLIGTTRTTIAAIRDRTHWNVANITPKDPVTAVTKAAKAHGIEAPVDTRLEGEREALIKQLPAERDQAARDAEVAATEGGARRRR
jgi:hypothetical protein